MGILFSLLEQYNDNREDNRLSCFERFLSSNFSCLSGFIDLMVLLVVLRSAELRFILILPVGGYQMKGIKLLKSIEKSRPLSRMQVLVKHTVLGIYVIINAAY